MISHRRHVFLIKQNLANILSLKIVKIGYIKGHFCVVVRNIFCFITREFLRMQDAATRVPTSPTLSQLIVWSIFYSQDHSGIEQIAQHNLNCTLSCSLHPDIQGSDNQSTLKPELQLANQTILGFPGFNVTVGTLELLPKPCMKSYINSTANLLGAALPLSC